MSLASDIRRMATEIVDRIPTFALDDPRYELVDRLNGFADLAEELEADVERADGERYDAKDRAETAGEERDVAYEVLRAAIGNADGWRERAKAVLK